MWMFFSFIITDGDFSPGPWVVCLSVETTIISLMTAASGAVTSSSVTALVQNENFPTCRGSKAFGADQI